LNLVELFCFIYTLSSSQCEQFLIVKVVDGNAYPVFKKSDDITSLSKADGYVVLPVKLDVIEEGEEITVALLLNNIMLLAT
jgi:molybdopterin biosynthesis enzyme